MKISKVFFRLNDEAKIISLIISINNKQFLVSSIRKFHDFNPLLIFEFFKNVEKFGAISCNFFSSAYFSVISSEHFSSTSWLQLLFSRKKNLSLKKNFSLWLKNGLGGHLLELPSHTCLLPPNFFWTFLSSLSLKLSSNTKFVTYLLYSTREK